MNYLYICQEVSKKNGWATISYNTIKQAAKNNQVTVLTSLYANNIYIDNVIFLKILPDFNNKIKLIDFIAIHYRIYREMKSRYDIAHVLVEPYAYILFFINSDKKILTAVGTYIIKSFRLNSIKHIFNRIALIFLIKDIVAISEYSKKVFNSLFYFKKCNYVVTPGVESPISLRYSKKEKIFCILGELKSRKGILYVLEAFSTFIKTNMDSKLILAGDYSSKYGQNCYNYAVDNNLINNVIFMGHIDSVDTIYNKAFCNILASQNTIAGDFEGFGLVHLEANSFGIPTIGTKNNGNESAIIDGVTGLLAEQNSSVSILYAMNHMSKLYDDNSIEIFNVCRSYALKKSWENYFLNLKDIYNVK